MSCAVVVLLSGLCWALCDLGRQLACFALLAHLKGGRRHLAADLRQQLRAAVPLLEQPLQLFSYDLQHHTVSGYGLHSMLSWRVECRCIKPFTKILPMKFLHQIQAARNVVSASCLWLAKRSASSDLAKLQTMKCLEYRE